MSFKADFAAHLRADGDVAALVGERITPGVRPQEAVPAAIVYSVVEDDELPNLAGSTGAQKHLAVRVECLARTFADARSLGEAVRSRMRTAAATFRAVITPSGADDFDAEARMYVRTLEFSCWYG